MNPSRRDLIRVTSALSLAFGSGLLTPAQVFGATRWGSDWNGAVYSARSLEAFVRAMQGDTTDQPTSQMPYYHNMNQTQYKYQPPQTIQQN